MSKTPSAVSGGAWARAGSNPEASSAAVRMIGRAVAHLGELISRRLMLQLERRAVAELSALDDRMLKDIGLTRGSIPHAVRSGLQEAIFHPGRR